MCEANKRYIESLEREKEKIAWIIAWNINNKYYVFRGGKKKPNIWLKKTKNSNLITNT